MGAPHASLYNHPDLASPEMVNQTSPDIQPGIESD